MILGLLQFWRGMRSHPRLRVPEEPVPEEPEREAGEEECRLLLLCFADGFSEDERDCDGGCCSTSNREEEWLKQKVRKESKVRWTGLRKKIEYLCAA
jgi:hypothetical protein